MHKMTEKTPITNPHEVVCPYCGKDAELVGGGRIHPGRSFSYAKWFWLCAPCNAYVGCHDYNPRYGFTGTEPLGRLANFTLRQYKRQAHEAFDPIWKNGGNRAKAYLWLAEQLGISQEECHIGMFDMDLCKRTIKLCFSHGDEGRQACMNTRMQRQIAMLSTAMDARPA
jgi:hypothetical protein